MRELRAGAVRSVGRDQWRAFYASYISSPDWFRRREEWDRDERERTGSSILCRGGCGTEWTLSSGDLHHASYDRLGEEAHEDLWAMCRQCHSRLHELMDSTKTWRRMPKPLANDRALAIVASENQTGSAPPRSLRDYL